MNALAKVVALVVEQLKLDPVCSAVSDTELTLIAEKAISQIANEKADELINTKYLLEATSSVLQLLKLQLSN